MLVSEALDRTFSAMLYPAGINRPAWDTLITTPMTAGSPAAGATFTTGGRVSIPPDTLLEIGSELISSSAVAGAVVTVGERGYLDTVAASHSVGDIISIDPQFPRKAAFDALNNCLGELYPSGLYVSATQSTTYSSTAGPSTLPAGGRRVLSIVCDVGTVAAVKYNRLIPGKDYLEFPDFSPMQYQLVRGGRQGGTMYVRYAKDFTPAATEADDLTTVCGVPTNLAPFLPMAIAGYLLRGRDIPRVQLEELRRQLAANNVNVGSALNIGQALIQQFQGYVVAERMRLREGETENYTYVPR